MAAKPKKFIGTFACLVCGVDIPVREAENGTLDVSCKYCDFPAYVKTGTEAHGIISASIKRKEDPSITAANDDPAGEKKPAAPAPAAPTKAKGKMP